MGNLVAFFCCAALLFKEDLLGCPLTQSACVWYCTAGPLQGCDLWRDLVSVSAKSWEWILSEDLCGVMGWFALVSLLLWVLLLLRWSFLRAIYSSGGRKNNVWGAWTSFGPVALKYSWLGGRNLWGEKCPSAVKQKHTLTTKLRLCYDLIGTHKYLTIARSHLPHYIIWFVGACCSMWRNIIMHLSEPLWSHSDWAFWVCET